MELVFDETIKRLADPIRLLDLEKEEKPEAK